MKKYIYVDILTYGVESTEGIVKINKGDIITKMYEEGEYSYCLTDNGRHITIKSEDIPKYFKRVFDKEEIDYYNHMRDKAAVAAMQGFIINGIDDQGNREDNMKYLVSASVQVANALVKELQEA